jgi:hypothetical protein
VAINCSETSKPGFHKRLPYPNTHIVIGCYHSGSFNLAWINPILR